MPRLNDANIKKVCKEVPTKGFSQGFWEAHRSGHVANANVGAALKSFNRYFTIDCEANKPRIDKDSLAAINKAVTEALDAYNHLNVALNKAKSKCGKPHSHTKQLCEAYISVMKKKWKEVERSVLDVRDGKMANEYKNITSAMTVLFYTGESAVREFEEHEAAIKATDDTVRYTAKERMDRLKPIGASLSKANKIFVTSTRSARNQMNLYDKMTLPPNAGPRLKKYHKNAAKAYGDAKKMMADFEKRIGKVEKLLADAITHAKKAA